MTRLRRMPLQMPAPVLKPMPPSIVAAVCRIGGDIESVKKSQFNAHGKYQYASADDIYAAVARRMAEAGLMILPVELECEIKRVETKNGTQQWAHVAYGFVLATEQETWFDPRSRRSIYLQVLGPQTFLAAEAYCQKQFLRGLWKMPTGDMDLDSLAQAETEEEFADANRVSKPKKRKSSYSAKKDGTDELFNQIRGEIQAASELRDQAAIMAVSRKYDGWTDMPAKWAQLLDDEFNDALDDARAVTQGG